MYFFVCVLEKKMFKNKPCIALVLKELVFFKKSLMSLIIGRVPVKHQENFEKIG